MTDLMTTTQATRKGSPLESGEYTLVIEGTQLRYRVAGQGPLLIFHPPGWGIGAVPYQATLSRLEELFTVVYLWPRGAAGVADPPESAALDVGAFVSDLEQLRRQLGVEEFGLAGHSHSSLTALHYTLRHRQRVKALCLLSPQLIGIPGRPDGVETLASAPETPEIAAARAYLESAGGLGAIFALRTNAEATDFLRRILPLYFRDPGNARSLATALEPLALPLRTLQAVSARDEAYVLPVDELRRLDVPTLIVAGRYDRFCPMGASKRLAQILPRARLLVFEESGHFPWLEEGERFYREAIPLLAGLFRY
jgi:proline iminopeptidase